MWAGAAEGVWIPQGEVAFRALGLLTQRLLALNACGLWVYDRHAALVQFPQNFQCRIKRLKKKRQQVHFQRESIEISLMPQLFT